VSESRPSQSKNESALRPGANVVSRRLDDQTVLVNLRTNRIFELNRTGARLWELIKDAPAESEIVARLVAEFEVSEEQVAREVASLIESLLEEGLILREQAS
jgi:hypothetical protein